MDPFHITIIILIVNIIIITLIKLGERKKNNNGNYKKYKLPSSSFTCPRCKGKGKHVYAHRPPHIYQNVEDSKVTLNCKACSGTGTVQAIFIGNARHTCFKCDGGGILVSNTGRRTDCDWCCGRGFMVYDSLYVIDDFGRLIYAFDHSPQNSMSLAEYIYSLINYIPPTIYHKKSIPWV